MRRVMGKTQSSRVMEKQKQSRRLMGKDERSKTSMAARKG